MKNENQETLVYTIDEFADLFKISKSMAYQIARADGFPKIRMGKRILIPKNELEQWMKEKCNGDSFKN